MQVDSSTRVRICWSYRVTQWLIIADDLTGACDATVPFAMAGLTAQVVWTPDASNETTTNIDALGIDLGTRASSADAAGHLIEECLSSKLANGRQLLKKIDSTLRGHPAVEIASIHRRLRNVSERALGVIAPAFPATGRTTRDGRMYLHGHPLEDSSLWQRDHSYDDANLMTIVAGVGLRARHASLATIRDAQSLQHLFNEALQEHADVLVCDVETQSDLECIAHTALPMSDTYFVGSAGLAHALAGSRIHCAFPVQSATPVLTLIGSAHEASRVAAIEYAHAPDVLSMSASSRSLFDQELPRFMQHAVDALRAGRDVILHMTDDIPAPAFDPALVQRLAAVSAPLMAYARTLVVSGGETARCALDVCGVSSLRLVCELEPGICFAEAQGARSFNVVTKAGAFGDAQCLSRIAQHLHSNNGTR